METQDFEQAQEWAIEQFGGPNLFQTWMPAEGFVKAERHGNSLAFTRGRDTPYGLGLGDDLHIDPMWQTFSIPRTIPKELTADFKLAGQWDAYVIDTHKVAEFEARGYRYESPGEDRVIADFLNEHAPESSTKPGHPEIVFWRGLLNDGGDLVAVAALTQWESGGHVLSSVAVHQSFRGQGLAQLLTASIVNESAHMGISHLVLGVAGKNAPAIAAYEKVGFTCMGRFNYFERA